MTGLLAGVYAGVVLLATEVLGITSPVAVAGATLVAAALFSPVAAFAARLQDATDLDGVRTDLLSVVHRSLEPAHASVWLPPDVATARGTPHGTRASRASS